MVIAARNKWKQSMWSMAVVHSRSFWSPVCFSVFFFLYNLHHQ